MTDTNRKKLLLVTSSFPFGEGEATFIPTELSYLAGSFDVTLISRNSKDIQIGDASACEQVIRYKSDEKYNALSLALRAIFSKPFRIELKKLAKSKRLDFSHIKRALRFMMRSLHFADFAGKILDSMGEGVTLYSYWNDYSAMALSLVRRPSDRFVSRAHGTDLYEREDNGYYLPMKQFINRNVDLLAFVSRQGRDYFLEKYGIDKNSGVFRLGTREHKKSDVVSKPDSISFFTLSHSLKVKRLDRVIDALSLIDTPLNIKWTHIGGGALQNEIIDYAGKKLSDRKNISFEFTGSMENEKAIDYILENRFDFLINTSDSEGLPVSMTEAMSMAIPVIALDVGGVSEIVRDSFNGFLLGNDASSRQIADAILKFARLDSASRRQLSENAYSTWKNEFDSDSNSQKFTECIYNL